MDAADDNAADIEAGNVAVEANQAVAAPASNGVAGQAHNGVADQANNGVAFEDDNDVDDEDDNEYANEYDFEMADEYDDDVADEDDNAVVDEAGDVMAVENKNAVAVEADNAAPVAMEVDDVLAVEAANTVAVQSGTTVAGEAGSSSAAGGDGDVFRLKPLQYPVVNKSVLWNLEAPIIGSFFDKYDSANIDRVAQVSFDVNHFGDFTEAINVDIMSVLPREEARARLTECLDIFKLRKTKYQQIMQEVQTAANDLRNCVHRLEGEWDTQRLDRALVNHLLRMRCINTAYNFALERNIHDLYNFEPFLEAEEIVKALRNKDLAPAKAWCLKNNPWGKLEFQIFCQQYIEYVRTNQKTVAISFAWKHTAELWGYKKELLHVLAAVAFGCDTPVLRYKKLFDEERWYFLIELFEEQFNMRRRFTCDASYLCILLESGITALKVPFCFDGEDCKKDDPLQHEPFRTFASTLPYARHSFPPKLVCHVTKQPLGEANPPYMLPNGYAYSKQAILGMRDGDQITCPRTGAVCNIRDVRELKLVGY